MTQYQIDRIDISQINSQSTLLNTTFSASTNTVTTIVNAAPTNVSYAGGSATITPSNSTAWETEVINFDPGDTTVDYNTPTTLSDNWPIPWTSNQLLKYTCGIQAPDATGETNPPDAITLQMDPASTEVLEQDLLALTTNKIGGPKASVVNDYTMFFYTHNKSASPISQLSFLRTRVGILCRSDLHTAGTKTGGLKITYEKVDVMDTSTF
jgi:hypothetical protein